MKKPFRPNMTPNQRWRCMDCRAVFSERESDKMYAHAKRTNFEHIGYTAVPARKVRA